MDAAAVGESVDLQAKAAADLDEQAVKSCDYFMARELVGLSRKRCRICEPCQAYEKWLAKVGFLRWTYAQNPMARDGETR